jgi:O-antigen/teichoic acid export membrane protein
MFFMPIKNNENKIKLNLDAKTKTVATNIVYSIGIKILTIGVSFLSVPLLINYLNSVQYGIWVTILTFTSWFTLFDLGLGNGLKNKLIEFVTSNNTTSARQYVSTTYISMSLICGAIGLMVCVISPFISWSTVFNVSDALQNSVSISTTIILLFTLLSMILRLINNLLHANQQSYKVDMINLVTQLVGFGSILLAKLLLKPSLQIVALTFSMSQLIVLLCANIYLFRKSFKNLIPSIKSYDYKLTKEVLNISGRFFFIQIAGLIMYMTDNFLIATLLGPNDVTVYNIALKYFTVLLTGWALILTPLWPMTTKAYFSGDITWINNTIKKLIGLWFITIVAGIIMLLLANMFYNIWIGKAVFIPPSVSLSMLFYSCISVFATIIATFINGIGKITLQAYITGFVAIINIPLAVFFSKTLNWGLVGVPFATTTCLLISSTFAVIQLHKIINLKASGIWDK